MGSFRVCTICGEWCYKQREAWTPYFGVVAKGWYHQLSALDADHKANPAPSFEQVANRQARQQAEARASALMAEARVRAASRALVSLRAPTRGRTSYTRPAAAGQDGNDGRK